MAKKKYLKGDIPTAKRVNPFIQVPYVEGSTPQGFLYDWVNSDEYKNRIQSNGYDNPDDIINNRLRNLENSKISYSHGVSSATPGSPTYKANHVNINPSDSSVYGNNVVVPHELSHLIGGTNPGQYDSSMSSFEKNFIDNSNINRSNVPREALPTEMKSDLDSNRYNLFKNNIYDIKQGQPFTQDHLNKAKESFQNDETFNRLIKQTGDSNYIDLMNNIASNKQPEQIQAKYGGKMNRKQYNPFLDEYFLGGLLGSGTTSGKGSGVAGMAGGMVSSLIPTSKKDGSTSVGGSAASGALSGFSAGAALGPIGMIGGAVLGGLSGLIGGGKAKREEARQASILKQQDLDQATSGMLANMNFGIGNGSNLPMAMGGQVDPNNAEIPIGSYNHFPVGGTHESNPLGGIPQGTNSQGQQMNVESGEGKFKFKDGDYIFSNRLIFE